MNRSCLLLSTCHFFNEDPGHCSPACIRISKFVAIVAASNPESHSHFSLVDVIAVTFNVAMTMKVFASPWYHIKCTVNFTRRAALGAIEFEIPTTAAVVTVVDPEITSEVNMEGSFRVFLHELAALQQSKWNKQIDFAHFI